MAKKISQLDPLTTALDGTAFLEIAQSQYSYKVTVNQLLEKVILENQHNELGGLQGGDSTNLEYYHLTSELYNQISSDPTTVIFSDDVTVGNDLTVSGDVDISGTFAIGDNASPAPSVLMYLNHDFNISSAAYGIYLSLENLASYDTPPVGTIGIGVNLQQNTSTLHSLIRGIDSVVNLATASATVTELTSIKATAFCTNDNSNITDMMAGDFKASFAASMNNTVVGSIIGGRFQILGAGSGDVDITDGFGVLIQSPSFNSDGTTTNLYGLYIEDQLAGGFTNTYNIYSAGATAMNYFEGNVQIDGVIGLQLASGVTVNEISNDPTLASDSTSAIVSEAAIKAFVESQISQSVTIPLIYRFSTSIVESDPGSKRFRLNEIIQSDSTEVYVNDITNNGLDAGAFISALDTGDIIYIQVADNNTVGFIFEVSGSATDNGGWWTIPVINGSSTGIDIENNENCVFVFNYV